MANAQSQMDQMVSKMISVVRINPPLFIGEWSLSKFASFLLGYEYALEECGADRSGYRMAKDFTSFEQRRHPAYEGRGWASILLIQARHDERLALEIFFADWDEYRVLAS